MRKIDEPQHPINHGVTQGDQPINGTEREAVDELLKEGIQEKFRDEDEEVTVIQFPLKSIYASRLTSQHLKD